MSKLMPEHVLEYPCVGMVNGYIRNIIRICKDVYSFEVWSDIVECFEPEGFRVSKNLDREFCVCKVFAIRKEKDDKTSLRLIRRNAVVNVVYKRYYVLGTERILNIVRRIEMPDSKYETAMLDFLDIDKEVATIFRFWADKIIKSSCFKVDFY